MTSTANHTHAGAAGPSPREFRREARMLPLAAIRFHPRNLRTEYRDLETLAARIHSQGVLKPLLAHRRWIPQPGKPEAVELIAGHRRLLAAEMAGLARVPVTVRARMDDDEALLAMLAEDSQDPLTAGERWSGIEALHTEFCYDLPELGRMLGWTPAEMTALREGRDPASQAARSGQVPMQRSASAQRSAPARPRANAPRMAPKRVHQLCQRWDDGTVSGAEIVDELRSMLGTWTPKTAAGGAEQDSAQAADDAGAARADGEETEGAGRG